jgi:HK97 family phage prohead protease
MSMHRKYIERPFEVKAGSLKADGTFEGHASVFGELDTYRDIVLRGAFVGSLEKDFAKKNRAVPMLWQHDTYNPNGNYAECKEDDIGLYVKGQCNMKVQQGVECHALMEQGALSGLSIGYSTLDDEWDDTGMIRKLKEVKLWEISPVTFPAGDSARVTSVKSISGLENLSDCETLLRDAGFSKSETTAFVSRVKALAMRSDSADVDAIAVKNALHILRNQGT